MDRDNVLQRFPSPDGIADSNYVGSPSGTFSLQEFAGATIAVPICTTEPHTWRGFKCGCVLALMRPSTTCDDSLARRNLLVKHRR
jgi:hypothetical protein